MSEYGKSSGPISRQSELFRPLLEFLQLSLLEALQELERLEGRLNELHTWVLRAIEIFNSSERAPLPPGCTPAELLAMLEAKKRGFPPEKSKRHKSKTDADRVLERAAQAGIRDFKMEPQADGSAIAIIDGIELRLSVTLAKLLSLLADPEIGLNSDGAPPASGNFVPFKPNQELSTHLQKTLNRQFPDGALRNLIHRLKKDFVEVGLNKYLIQTAPGGRRRLALQWHYTEDNVTG